MHGLLNINKPAGVTSRDVVNRVQRLVKPAKVGHAGTLDPLATGVLIVCVGAATRLVEFVQQMPKHYTGVFRLGCQSDTEDVEGEIHSLADSPELTPEVIEGCLPNFIGQIQQRPPAYSALKIQGQRAYRLARAGKEVDVAPRTIQIHDLQLRALEYPHMTLDIICGSGTYVRSLGRDIAQSLHSGAVMEQLERTAIGDFPISVSVSPDELDRDSLTQFLLPMRSAVSTLTEVPVNVDEMQRLAHGRTIGRDDVQGSGPWAAVGDDGALIAILASRGDGQVGPTKYLGNAT